MSCDGAENKGQRSTLSLNDAVETTDDTDFFRGRTGKMKSGPITHCSAVFANSAFNPSISHPEAWNVRPVGPTSLATESELSGQGRRIFR